MEPDPSPAGTTVGTSAVPVSARTLLAWGVPAAVVGAGCSLVLLALSKIAGRLEHFIWSYLPAQLGFGHWDRWWMLLVLTLTGTLVGLVVWKAPGHAGPDPATLGLVDPPEPPAVMPSVAAATVLALAGGVSLGPENPITMINISLSAWLGRRFRSVGPPVLWVGFAAAGTVGALFGTPVAAALILSEMTSGRAFPGSLWDRLFAPLVAAVSGSMTTLLLAGNEFVIDVPAYPGTRVVDVLWALLIGSAGAALGMAAVYAFAPLYRSFAAISNPVLMLTAGGLVLGVLGAIGGHLTLFKGLEEVKELAASFEDYSAWALLGLALVKVASLLIASTSGFRGGRIFPAVFIGTALGCAVHAAIPSVPVSLGIACAILGILFAVTRQAWLSLFTAAVIVPDTRLLPLLCVASLPAWLIVTGRPQMGVRATADQA